MPEFNFDKYRTRAYTYTATFGEDEFESVTVTADSEEEALVLATDRLSDLCDEPADLIELEDEHAVIYSEAFFEYYQPRDNHIEPENGQRFETYGDELEFVRAQPENTIWTLLDADGVNYIAAGYHHVNRMSYYVATVPRSTAEENRLEFFDF